MSTLEPSCLQDIDRIGGNAWGDVKAARVGRAPPYFREMRGKAIVDFASSGAAIIDIVTQDQVYAEMAQGIYRSGGA